MKLPSHISREVRQHSVIKNYYIALYFRTECNNFSESAVIPSNTGPQEAA